LITGLVAFFQALPRILELCSKVGQYLKDREVQRWLTELERSMEAVEKAKTVEEKQNAARALVHTVRSIK
jgi:hypothetical protein